MLHHPRPRTPMGSGSFTSQTSVIDITRPPTRSEKLLRDALLKDETIRTSGNRQMPSPSRQRSQTTPNRLTSSSSASPSRTATPTPMQRASTSPAPGRRQPQHLHRHHHCYHHADDEFTGSPPSPTRMVMRRSSKSEGSVTRSRVEGGSSYLLDAGFIPGSGFTLHSGGARSTSPGPSGRGSPTPHEIVLRARLEGVLSAARKVERRSSSSRAHSPSPSGSSTESKRGHTRRLSLQQGSNNGVVTRKRSSTTCDPSSRYTGALSSSPSSTSQEDEDELEPSLLTPPPTPPNTSPYKQLDPCQAHMNPQTPPHALSTSNRHHSDPIPSFTTPRSPRSPAAPRLVHSTTSPPGTLPLSPSNRLIYQRPYADVTSDDQEAEDECDECMRCSECSECWRTSSTQLTPPESGSPSPSTSSPPRSPRHLAHHHTHQHTHSRKHSLRADVPHLPSSLSSSKPQFNARKASERCRAIEGYVSFAAVEGLGMPEGLDELDDDATTAGEGGVRKGWMGLGMGIFGRG